jgi:hypothetical protein
MIRVSFLFREKLAIIFLPSIFFNWQHISVISNYFFDLLGLEEEKSVLKLFFLRNSVICGVEGELKTAMSIKSIKKYDINLI